MAADRDLDDDLALAFELAGAADAVTFEPFQAGRFTVAWKGGGDEGPASEVTEIDRGAEAAIVERLATARPDDAVFGEELGRSGGGVWRWVIDPIDGTSGYVRGIPVWATLIALVHDASPVVAVVSAPALGRRWWAVKGGGTFADGRRCAVSAVTAVADAQVAITFSAGWDQLGLTPALVELAAAARRARGFGDFWQHALVAEGAIDIAVDAVGVAPYDLAAVRLLVEEAGGTFTDRIGTVTHEHDTAVSSNGHLHAEVMRRLVPPDIDR